MSFYLHYAAHSNSTKFVRPVLRLVAAQEHKESANLPAFCFLSKFRANAL